MSSFENGILEVFDRFTLPECDDREYRAVKLENGLTAFLVSDKETKISGCCLTVNIGAMYSPKNLQGLAHFLEHMLFCGTRKYPDVDEYQKFILSHGGKRQGITTRSTTTYYFEIKNEAFTEALDRFSSFFIEPIFCKKMVEKEVSAIENEFHLKYQSDDRVRFHLLAQLSEESHPLNCFTTGNKETLLDNPEKLNIDVHKELLEFYNRYYSSNIMSVLIYGKENIDVLQNYSVKFFSKIPNNNVACMDYDMLFKNNPPYSTSNSIGKFIKLIPYETDKRLKIYFPLPPLDKYTESCAYAYVSHVISHKGEGSISSVLRRKKLATSASFFITNDDPCALAQFGVVLTDLGYNNIKEVVRVIFSFLMLFKSTPIIPELVSEFIGLTESCFKYQPKPSIIDLFGIPAKYLKYRCKPEEIISLGFVVKDFSEKDVYMISDFLNINNCFMLLSSKNIEEEYKNNPESFKTEYYYNSKYSISEFDSDIRETLSEIDSNQTVELGLFLPKPNQFVSTDFSIVNEQIKCTNDFDRVPELLVLDGLVNEDYNTPRVWFKPDTTFNSPHSIINMRLVITNIPNIVVEKMFSKYKCFQNELIFQVFGEILERVMYRCLHQYSSDIQAASLSYNINYNARTNVFVIQGVGLSQKLDYLVTFLFDILFNKTTSEEHYEEAINLIKKDWENKIQKPNLITFSLECVSETLSPQFYNKKEKLLLLENFSHKLFCDIRLSFFRHCKLEGLIMGNYLVSDAKKMVVNYWNNLNNFTNSIQLGASFEVVEVEPFSVIRLNSDLYTLNYLPNPSDKNGCWLLSFYVGEFDVKTQAICDVILPFITSEIFAELRTNQQLAYVVRATQVFTSPVIIVGYYIQSSEFNNSLVLKRLLEFHTNKVKSQLRDKLDNQLFKKLLDSAIQTLSSNPKSIFDEYKSYLHEINERSFIFNIRKMKVEILKKLEYQEFIEFYDRVWNSKSILTEIRSQIDSEKRSEEADFESFYIPKEYRQVDPINLISRDPNALRVFLEEKLS
ncbi:insulinase-like peptidase [Cryptosporidium xiaoi]|uniref:Insulinase-like peptidase n=1 Tax=Cryptosporidium xiaoi TaxID=659607 RepID=A0AAV9XWI1_9CRYT